jgi:PTS system nitrogen regulatory IIA component
MTHPDAWLQPDDIELDVRLPNKRMTLEALARHLAARHGGDPHAVFVALWEREALGSTGLGHGVALPHARLPGLKTPIGAFLRLHQAIAFDAPDDKPVALVLGLLLPRQEPQRQLELLAHIAGLLSEARFREEVGQADDAHIVAKLFAGVPPT